LHSYGLADLDAVAVDVEHILEGIRGDRIEEADDINKILEVGIERRDTALSSSTSAGP
jgi:hypothetical protein